MHITLVASAHLFSTSKILSCQRFLISSILTSTLTLVLPADFCNANVTMMTLFRTSSVHQSSEYFLVLSLTLIHIEYVDS